MKNPLIPVLLVAALSACAGSPQTYTPAEVENFKRLASEQGADYAGPRFTYAPGVCGRGCRSYTPPTFPYIEDVNLRRHLESVAVEAEQDRENFLREIKQFHERNG